VESRLIDQIIYSYLRLFLALTLNVYASYKRWRAVTCTTTARSDFTSGAMLRPISRALSSSVRNLPTCLVSAREKGVPIDVHPEVEQALVERQPLVALETTIVTHGMPYPVNLETAKSVERHVRSAGVIPATIGVIGGRVKIGLETAQLEYLADSRVNTSTGPVKLSRRDIAAAIASKKDGGTTCSATLIFAALAGIKVLASFTL